MAQQWIYIPSDPRTDTQYEPNGYWFTPGGGTRVSGGMSSGSYNKTGFTDAELAYAYALMMALSDGVADVTYAERGGYTAPVRAYSPYVFRPGQAGVKALIHFDENLINLELGEDMDMGWIYQPKDETGRLWNGRGEGPEYSFPLNPTFRLATPAKFGPLAFTREATWPEKAYYTGASEDFNFGSGDFCIAGWMILGAVGAYDTLWNNLTGYEGCWLIWQFFSNGYSPLRHNPAKFRGHSAVIESTGDSGRLIWKFSNFEQTETYTLTYEFAEADFDDQYHYFAFARHGDVFTMYIDGVPVASETHAITLAYNAGWYFYYFCQTFTLT